MRLRSLVEEDRRQGRKPFCVVANAGTTNTGAIDPLSELANICAAEELWLHVDEPHGAAAAMTPMARSLFAGMERADSVTVDPHKWLFQPFEMGCVLIRDKGRLREAFGLIPEYVKQPPSSGDDPSYYEQGIQLSRGFRALKLWMSLKVFGAGAFRRAIE